MVKEAVEEVAGVAMVLLEAGLGAVKKEVMLAFAFGFLADAAARSAALRLTGALILLGLLGGWIGGIDSRRWRMIEQ